MDDEELQAIRAQRMAQLQNQYGVRVHVQRISFKIMPLTTSRGYKKFNVRSKTDGSQLSVPHGTKQNTNEKRTEKQARHNYVMPTVVEHSCSTAHHITSIRSH